MVRVYEVVKVVLCEVGPSVVSLIMTTNEEYGLGIDIEVRQGPMPCRRPRSAVVAGAPALAHRLVVALASAPLLTLIEYSKAALR